MHRLLIAIATATIGVAVVGTALAMNEPDGLNPAAVEPKKAAVDELVDDPEANSPPIYPPDRHTDKPPTYVPGRAQLMAPSSEIARTVNPDQDPTIRICRNPDGTYMVIHTTPAPGKNPYPNDPEDLRNRPC